MIASRPCFRQIMLLLLALVLLSGVAAESQAQTRRGKRRPTTASKKKRAAAHRHAPPVSLKKERTLTPRTGVIIGDMDVDSPPVGGPIGPAAPGSTPDITPPTPRPPVSPSAQQGIRSPIRGGVLNGKAISKPQPPYPPIAKAARAQGIVTVLIIVDEEGIVISAKAVSGHPLLQQAAVNAARQARFSPTMLSGQPVKVSGVITYNFVLVDNPPGNTPHTR